MRPKLFDRKVLFANRGVDGGKVASALIGMPQNGSFESGQRAQARWPASVASSFLSEHRLYPSKQAPAQCVRGMFAQVLFQDLGGP